MNCKLYCFLQHSISYSLTNDLSFSLSDCSFSLSLFSSFTSLSQSLNPCLPHFLSLPYYFLNLPQHLSHWHFHASIIIYLLYCLCLCLTQIELPVVFRSRNESFAGRPTLLNIMNIKTPWTCQSSLLYLISLSYCSQLLPSCHWVWNSWSPRASS